MTRDIDIINARKLFPDLKSDDEVTEKHMSVARKALAAQIARKYRPPVARSQISAFVHNEVLRRRRGQTKV